MILLSRETFAGQLRDALLTDKVSGFDHLQDDFLALICERAQELADEWYGDPNEVEELTERVGSLEQDLSMATDRAAKLSEKLEKVSNIVKQ